MDPVSIGVSAGGSLGIIYILSRIIERLIDKRSNGPGQGRESVDQINTLTMVNLLNDIKGNTALLVEQQKGMFSALRQVCGYREKEGH